MNKEILAAFQTVCPVLKWDRYTESTGQYTYYGWISRSDDKSDFLVINFNKGEVLKKVWYCTSSAKYSEAFCKLIGGSAHSSCIKVIE